MAIVINTQKGNRTKFAKYSEQDTSCTRAYMGDKTVNDAYKGGGAEALQRLDLYINIPLVQHLFIEAGTPMIVK